jgi:hypothetical protein
MGTENLDASKSARVLEMYVALIGIVILTPIYLPEKNSDLRELVTAKFIPYARVIALRILLALFTMMLMIGLYIVLLRNNNCIFPIVPYYFGTLAEALFLGGMGFCAYGIFKQIAVGYLLPVMYYITAFGAGTKLMKAFYPFSMIYGSYREKLNLAVAGIVLVIIGLTYPYLEKRFVFKRKLRAAR